MAKTRHILQVVHGLAIGGTEKVVCDLARAFNKHEYRTSICCLDEIGSLGDQLQKEGFNVYHLARRPGVDFSLIRRLHSLYREQQISIVHAHQYTPYFYAAAAAFGAKPTPVIFTEHGRHFPDRLRVRRVIFNQILRLTTYAYTAVSEFTRQSMIRCEKMPAHEIRVIYNGVHLNGNISHADERERIRREAGLGPQDSLVLTVGRMDPVKDFGMLIRAFSRLAMRLPNAKLWIVGDGDPQYKKQLSDIVERLGLAASVKFLGARHDVGLLLCASDVFALSSITEATSMTILEAMIACRAVVATHTGGNPELVKDGVTGFLVPVGDAEAMADALSVLLRDPRRRDSMGLAGRRKVKEQFSGDRNVAEYRALYSSV